MNNPLMKYRPKGIQTKLPSNLINIDPSVFAQPIPNEGVVTMPFRAKDEILLASPDALLTGYAIEEVLKGCVENLVDPGKLPYIDVEYLLMVIHKNTYGDNLEYSSSCDHCKEENNVAISIEELMANTKFIEEEFSVTLSSGLKVFLKPINLRDKSNIQVKLLELMENLRNEDEKDISLLAKKAYEANSSQLNKAFDLFTAATSKIVTTENEVVTDSKMISEFYSCIDTKDKDKIDGTINNMNSFGMPRKVPYNCQKCGCENTLEISYNPAFFFKAN